MTKVSDDFTLYTQKLTKVSEVSSLVSLLFPWTKLIWLGACYVVMFAA